MSKNLNDRKRWWALYILCLGTLMIVLDATIVNVALPSIRQDLGFSVANLAWVVNAYLLTFGGFLLLSGRLSDTYGHRKLFLLGLVIFTLASITCGISTSQLMLIASRAVQGLGGAIVSAVGLSLIMDLFTEPHERAKAIGVSGFVASGGGSLGVLLGGLLTTISWHWIFLVNIPVGVIVMVLAYMLLPKTYNKSVTSHLDILGAITITASLMLAVYAIVNGNIVGWTSFQTLGLLGVSVVLLVAFVGIESKVKSPLIPLGLFTKRNIVVANTVAVLWAAAMFASFFLSALYMQLILHYTPLQVGLAFLPTNIIMAIFSLGLSAKIVMKFGIPKPLAVGFILATIALLLFAVAPVNGTFLINILPSMILIGIGAGIAFNPMLMAAMSDVKQDESGLASGVVNIAFMMGGALGLAILASIAASRTLSQIAHGQNHLFALNSGYHVAFFVGAIFAGLAATLGGLLLRVTHISP